ncbi:MAG: YkgJ family cysteine cluster protein [Candidatus Gastranaerophilaceae bacterium]
MLEKYSKFVENFQKEIDKYFEEQSEYIHCHEGCAGCCEIGEYPFSWIEMGYLMEGFSKLPKDIKYQIKLNFQKLQKEKSGFKGERFEYQCPFLINKKCSVYDYRGLTCRTYGLAYLKKDGTVNVPYCANNGLNYSNVFKDGVFSTEPIKKCLNIDYILKDFDGEMGEIRPLADWLLK